MLVARHAAWEAHTQPHRLARRALRACKVAPPACAPARGACSGRSAARSEGPLCSLLPQAALKAQLESIRVVIHETKFTHTEDRQFGAQALSCWLCGALANYVWRADGGASALTGGHEAVNKVLAKAAGVSTSSAAGKVQSNAQTLRGMHKVEVFNIGTVVMAEMVIRYTQRARLVRPCLHCSAGVQQH